MRRLLLCGLLIASGCHPADTPSQPAPAPREAAPVQPDLEVHPNRISEDYTYNSAAADQKYKGRAIVTKMPWLEMGRDGGKTVVRSGRLVYRFASEDEAAKVQPTTFYRVRGTCEGLSGGDLVIANVRILGEWPAVK